MIFSSSPTEHMDLIPCPSSETQTKVSKPAALALPCSLFNSSTIDFCSSFISKPHKIFANQWIELTVKTPVD
jgi:hypothetical protein